MAKKSWIARNEKRKIIVNKYAEKRQALKEAGDYEGLQKLKIMNLITHNYHLNDIISFLMMNYIGSYIMGKPGLRSYNPLFPHYPLKFIFLWI